MEAEPLRPGTRLHWYTVDALLGRGGFGITYRGTDTNLAHTVAIKEYLPAGRAGRGAGSDVVSRIGNSGDDSYEWGLARFIEEARTLVKLQHPNIVRVLSVFEENGTAYMAMEYLAGKPLNLLP